MKKLIKHTCFCILAMLLISVSFTCSVVIAQQNYSNTTVNNDSGKPLNLISIADDEGNRIADVFMSGKEMQFDNRQRPIKGEGYIQALPGKYFHVLFLIGCDDKKTGKQRRKQIQLGVNRIEWDKQGKTIDIRGIEAVIKTSLGETFKVVSGLERPKVKDGILTISIEGKGNIPLVIRFQDDASIPKDQQCRFF
jgi:hypothetical protein